jgi:uncharacterized protein YciI
MPYVLICKDAAGKLDVRLANREAHLAYAQGTGLVSLAGPFLTDRGDMAGSLVVLDVETRAEAEAWAADDPYARAGLFESIEIHRWKKTVG